MSTIDRNIYYVYILTNPNRSALYTGVTNDLAQRLHENYLNKGKRKSFTSKYFCHNLIYYEEYGDINEAIAREKEIKGWRREKKVELIHSKNLFWKFLNKEVCGKWPPRNPLDKS